MQCLECKSELQKLDNEHLLSCCGLTLHEYALRHHLPLDLVLSADQVNVPDRIEDYPPAIPCPGETARGLLQGIRLAGLLRPEGDYLVIPGDIRRLDLLLWNQRYLSDFGFCFRQEYRFDTSTNRVIADNRLKARRRNFSRTGGHELSLVTPPDFLMVLASCVAQVGELHAGYLFIPVPDRNDAQEITQCLKRHWNINMVVLDTAQPSGGVMLRSYRRRDSDNLFKILSELLQTMPGVWERFHATTPEVTVVKELVFDSAHFITDHPAKCSNLHGGRYTLQVKVAGRIDPASACVIDYGYLKRVVNQRVVERFDHHNLNYVASELAWRSSTEMLCVYIWEQLIDYLPGLVELQLYETGQSWCHYSGPDLDSFQVAGSSSVLHHFNEAGQRDARLCAQIAGDRGAKLSVVA
ncbi:MAG TPA: 6-carboxytetrahydropterin synthase [Gammaproteobacteria bacterium]|nr:6-carboxytetrahydropterin synthase [Gammaproteobacteria bacterium]